MFVLLCLGGYENISQLKRILHLFLLSLLMLDFNKQIWVHLQNRLVFPPQPGGVQHQYELKRTRLPRENLFFPKNT